MSGNGLDRASAQELHGQPGRLAALTPSSGYSGTS
jgi:hypothetical protein